MSIKKIKKLIGNPPLIKINYKYNVDAFISGIGTGETLVGADKRLKEISNTDIVD